MNERLYLTRKDIWLKASSEEITRYFGYEADENFNNALKAFREKCVYPARISEFLAPLAISFFNR